MILIICVVSAKSMPRLKGNCMDVSSVESQKGIRVPRCSVESQKGVITVPRWSVENQKGDIAVQSRWQLCPSGSQQNIFELQ